MRILFIHDNFPAQFGAFGQWLAQQGWDVMFATARKGAEASGMRVLSYAPHREPSAQTHPYAQPLDKAAINGQGFVRAALAARASGWRPDAIMAHSGWGAGMFAKDVFPDAVAVPFFEWWYNEPAPDAAFLARETPETGGSVEAPMLQRARNAPILMDFSSADAALTPTLWQQAQFPPMFRSQLRVLHDGVDVDLCAPAPQRPAPPAPVPADAEVVTFAVRGLEPQRGFPQFMRALPAILAARPRAHAVIAGENRVAYGGAKARAVDWKARMLAEVDLDPARVHFVGWLPRAEHVALLQRSDAHVYLTAPFVLSWSMLEAMAIGCPLIAADVAPVREFAEDGRTARLVDFFDIRALADAVIDALADPGAMASLRAAARARVLDGLSRAAVFPQKQRWLEDLRAAR